MYKTTTRIFIYLAYKIENLSKKISKPEFTPPPPPPPQTHNYGPVSHLILDHSSSKEDSYFGFPIHFVIPDPPEHLHPPPPPNPKVIHIV